MKLVLEELHGKFMERVKKVQENLKLKRSENDEERVSEYLGEYAFNNANFLRHWLSKTSFKLRETPCNVAEIINTLFPIGQIQEGLSSLR
jgi:hypothetical protein